MVGGSVHWLSNFTVGLVFLYMEVRTNHRAKPCLKIGLFTPYRKALRSCKCTHWFPEPVCGIVLRATDCSSAFSCHTWLLPRL